MTLPTLFSRTSTGAVQTWFIETEGDKYRTVFGQKDGAIQTTNWTVCYPTNEGRANARNGEEQAVFEAKALWKKKKESGCFEDIKDIDTSLFTEPMLAKKYEDYNDSLQFPVYCQPKLDGCLHEDVLVQTEHGLVKIKDIREGVRVFTYNTNNELDELKHVKRCFKNAIDIREHELAQWYKITLEDGKSLKLTGNHRVWVDNLKCWRRVDSLDGTEECRLYRPS